MSIQRRLARFARTSRHSSQSYVVIGCDGRTGGNAATPDMMSEISDAYDTKNDGNFSRVRLHRAHALCCRRRQGCQAHPICTRHVPDDAGWAKLSNFFRRFSIRSVNSWPSSALMCLACLGSDRNRWRVEYAFSASAAARFACSSLPIVRSVSARPTNVEHASNSVRRKSILTLSN